MRRQIYRLGIGIFVLYLALFARLNQLQFFTAEELEAHPNNSRPLISDFGAPRGSIRAADGTVIAESISDDSTSFERKRVYPLGDLFAEATGFYSFAAGSDGLESTWDSELSGESDELSSTLSELFGADPTTADVNTTLSVELQQAARDALGERRGSVVVLQPSTGAVEALWSWPTYDPNPLSDVDTAAAQTARDALLDDPSNPLLPRTTREVFFPGSTFKVITATAAIDEGVADLESPVFPQASEYTPPLTNRALANFGDATCGGDLAEVIQRSCNTAIAQLGVELLGPEPLIDKAEDFGFNDVPPISLPNVEPSTMPTEFGTPLGAVVEIEGELLQQYEPESAPQVPLLDNMPAVAQAANGQFDVKATPLQMALVAATIANDGEVPSPHIVQSVISSDGSVLHRANTDPWQRATSPETAAQIETAMVGVVEQGTGQRVAVEGLEVGAKTGTAQLGEGIESTHAWVIAFAGRPGAQPEVAIAVLVEADDTIGEQTGGRVAGPVAQVVLEKWLALQ